MDVCRFCGSSVIETRQTGPHLGQYCVDCGQWQRWIKNPDNIDDGIPASDAQNNYAYRLMKRYMDVKPRLTAKQAGAIIQWLGKKDK